MKILTIFTLLLPLTFNQANAFIPEASGGAKVGKLLVVAGDEEPSFMWIGENPSSMIKTKVSGAKWDDMESLATINDEKFFAMTSHSLTKKGKSKPEREQLILLSSKNNKLQKLKSWTLRGSLLSYIAKNLSKDVDQDEVQNGTPDTGGLNIEGMAFLNGKLYLGLRSPITHDNEAIILVVTNAETSPLISGHALVDLKGNGIRSMETDGNKLLVISGSRHDSDTYFGLHYFTPGVGVTNSVSVAGFSKLLRPESVIKYSDQSLIFLQDFEQVSSQDVMIQLSR